MIKLTFYLNNNKPECFSERLGLVLVLVHTKNQPISALKLCGWVGGVGWVRQFLAIKVHVLGSIPLSKQLFLQSWFQFSCLFIPSSSSLFRLAFQFYKLVDILIKLSKMNEWDGLRGEQAVMNNHTSSSSFFFSSFFLFSVFLALRLNPGAVQLQLIFSTTPD